MQLVNPHELADVFPVLTQPPEDLAVHIQLVDMTVRIGGKKKLVWRRRHTDCPRSTESFPFGNEVEIRVEHLNTAVPAITDEDPAFGICGNRVRRVELERIGPTPADGFHEIAVLREFDDA